jgi:hypothetical protein
MSKRNSVKKPSPSLPIIPEKLRELEEHLLFKDAVTNSLIPFMKAKKEAEDEKRKFVPNLQQQYGIEVFYNSYCLFEAVKRLYDILYIAKNNPNFTILSNHGVVPEDWFVYHYANFRVIATGIYDTALIVTNFLLKIDLPARKCTDQKIRHNPRVVEKKLDVPLAKLKTLIDKYRKERNSYVHRGERPKAKIVDNLKAYRFLKEAKEKGFYKKKLPNLEMEYRYFMEQRDQKCTEMKNGADEICSSVLELFGAWYPIYLEFLAKSPDRTI